MNNPQQNALAADGWEQIWLPYPPSVNTAFRNVSGGGRRKTYGYGRWRRLACQEIMVQRPAKFRGAYEIEIITKRPDNKKRDIDNLIKPVSDALVVAGVVVDDSDCVKVMAQWVTESTKGGVIVRIRKWEAA